MASPTTRKPRLPIVLERRLLLERLEDRLAPGSMLSLGADSWLDGYDASQTSVLPESDPGAGVYSYATEESPVYDYSAESFDYAAYMNSGGDFYGYNYDYSSYTTTSDEADLVTYYAGYDTTVSPEVTGYDYYSTADTYYSPVYDASVMDYGWYGDSGSYNDYGSSYYDYGGYEAPYSGSVDSASSGDYYGESNYYTGDYTYNTPADSGTPAESDTSFADYNYDNYYGDSSYGNGYSDSVYGNGGEGTTTTENTTPTVPGHLPVRLNMPRLTQNSNPLIFVEIGDGDQGWYLQSQVAVDVDLNQDGQFQDNELNAYSVTMMGTSLWVNLPTLPQEGYYMVRARATAGDLIGEDTRVLQFSEKPTGPGLRFEANQGQTAEQVEFVSRGVDYALWLSGGDVYWHGKTARGLSTFSMKLVGANENATPVAENALTTVSNYFIGDDPSKYITNIANYGSVRYQNVYDGIDVVYQGVEGQLRHDFVVAAGADYRNISLNFGEHAWAMLNGNGEIILMNNTTGGVAFLSAPRIFQYDDNGQEVAVSGHFTYNYGGIGFEITGAYDTSRELIIDPTLAYSTFAGGSLDENETFGIDENFGGGGGGGGFDDDILDTPGDIVVDSSGNAYIVGSTLSANFPVTTGPTFSGGRDGFVYKLDAAGTTLQYASYFGGDWDDDAFGAAINGSNELFVVGRTSENATGGASPTFSTGGATNLVRVHQGGEENHAFLVKFDAAGTLVWGSFLAGGSESGDHRTGAYDVALDAAGNPYVVGNTSGGDGGALQAAGNLGDALYTSSAGAATVFQPDAATGGGGGFGQPTHGFLMKLLDVNLNATAAASAVDYSTYVTDDNANNGDERTYLRAVVVDSLNQAVVGGFSSENAFAGNPTYTIEGATFFGGYDMVLAKIDATGQNLVWATYLGGSGSDRINALAIAADDSIYIGGESDSGGGGGPFTAMDTTATAFRQNRTSSNPGGGNDEQYRSGWVGHVAADGSALLAGTYIGATGNVRDRVTSIQVDGLGRVYVGGITEGPDFPRLDPLQAAFASPDSSAGGANNALSDGFVSVFDPNLSALLFSTTFGGRADDGITGLALDSTTPNPDIFITGFTDSRSGAGATGDFPIQDAFQVQNAGGRDAFVARITNDIPGTTPGGPGTVTPAPDAFEDNNTSDIATDLGTIASSTDVNDLTITPDTVGLPDYDWFRFIAGAGGTLRVSTTVTVGGDKELFLYRLDGNTLTLLDSNQTTSVNTRSVSASVSAGQTLLIQTKGRNSSLGVQDNSAYNMTIDFI